MTDRPETPPVVILKTQSYPLHSGTIAAARTLGRLGAPVHIFGEPAGSPIARSRYVRSVLPLPSPDPPSAELADWLGDRAVAEQRGVARDDIAVLAISVP